MLSRFEEFSFAFMGTYILNIIWGSLLPKATFQIFKLTFLISQGSPLGKHTYSKFIEIFTTKNWKFSDKKSDTFYISAHNIDYGYSLEPPQRDGSNEYPQSIFEQKSEK